MTTKEKLKALSDYLMKEATGTWHMNTETNHVYIENENDKLLAKTFLAAISIGYNIHVKKANKYVNETITPLRERVEKVEDALKECKKEVINNYNRGCNDGYLSAKASCQQAYKDLEKAASEGNKKAYDRGFSEGANSIINVRAQGEYNRGVKDGKTEGIKLTTESYISTITKATDHFAEYLKNVKEQTEVEAFEKGKNYASQFAWIPMDAFDVEVFAIKPSDDFETGQQAFIGFKVPGDGGSQFRFIQIQHSVTNPNKKYGNKNNKKEGCTCDSCDGSCEKTISRNSNTGSGSCSSGQC